MKRKQVLLSLILSFVFVVSGAILSLFNFSVIAEETTSQNKEVLANVAADGLVVSVYNDSALTVETVNGQRRITSYNENNIKSLLKEKIETMVGDETNRTAITKMLFNVNYTRAMTDSQVVDSAAWTYSYDDAGQVLKDESGNPIRERTTFSSSNWFDRYRALIEAGIDIFDYSIDITHDIGVEAWVSVRVNDSHYKNNTDGSFSSFRDTKASRRLSSTGTLNFADPSVRQYMKNYIVELATNYDIDGIELDMLRDVRYFDTTTSETIKVMNDWMKEIRVAVDEVAQKKGTNIELYARTYITEEESLSISLDVAQWIADGSIDGIIISGYDLISYDYPIGEWRSSISEKNTENNSYKLICGGSHYITCINSGRVGGTYVMDADECRGFASGVYNQGGDGVYFFNTYAHVDLSYHNVTPEGVYTEYKGSAQRLRDCYEDLSNQEDAETGKRTYIIETTMQKYPFTLKQGESFEYALNTGTAPNKGYYNILVGVAENEGYLNDNFTVTVNGNSTQQQRDYPRTLTHVYDSSTRIYHVSEAAQRMMQFLVSDLSILKDDRNVIKITNNSEDAQQILWIQVDVNSAEDASIEQSVYNFNAPQNLAVSIGDSGAPLLTWENQGTFQGVAVYRKTLTDAAFTQIATINASSESYIDDSAVSGTNYYYRLKYLFDDKESIGLFTNTVVLTNESPSVGFLTTDFVTGIDWEGTYGEDGYVIFGYAEGAYSKYGVNMMITDYPSVYAQTSLTRAPDYLERMSVNIGGGRASGSATSVAALNKPNAVLDKNKYLIVASNKNIAHLENETPKETSATFYLKDCDEHIFTAYFAEYAETNAEELIIYIKDLDGKILTTVNITPSDFVNGGYISFKIKGSFSISFYSQIGLNAEGGYGFAAFFFDEYNTFEDKFEKKTFIEYNFDTLNYDVALEGEYAYILRDAKTIYKYSLVTKQIVATYTETAENVEFATTWSGISTNTNTQKKFISVSNGIICVALASCNDGVGGLMTAPVACRLIDFNGTTAKAKFFRLRNNWTNVSSMEISGTRLYMTLAENLYVYNVESILNTDYYETNMATASSNDIGYCTGRNMNHLKDTRGDEIRNGKGNISSFKIYWNEMEDGLVITTPLTNDANTISIDVIQQAANGKIGNSTTDTLLKISELKNDSGIGVYKSTDAKVFGDYVFILNSPDTSLQDNGIIIYNWKISNIPTFLGMIKLEGYSCTSIEIYDGYLLVGSDDYKIHVFDIETMEEIRSYEVDSTPVKMQSIDGYLYIVLRNGSFATIS